METVKYDLCLLQDVNGLTTMYRLCTLPPPSKLADTGPLELLLGIVVEPCSEQGSYCGSYEAGTGVGVIAVIAGGVDVRVAVGAPSADEGLG